VTLFSAPNYCGEFDNSGAVMAVEEDLTCSFQVIPPLVSQKKGKSKSNKNKNFDENQSEEAGSDEVCRNPQCDWCFHNDEAPKKTKLSCAIM